MVLRVAGDVMRSSCELGAHISRKMGLFLLGLYMVGGKDGKE